MPSSPSGPAEPARPAPAGASGAPHPPVAGLLLAAGGGRRLGGRPKALLDLRGRPLVENAVRVLREGGCATVWVVLGAAAEQVVDRADLRGCEVVRNEEWAAGMGTSLRAGLAALSASAAPGTSAAVVSLVDQPGIGAAAVARVLAAHGNGETLAAAGYAGDRGHPVLFGAGRWADVAASAGGDRGARDYLRAHRAELALVECGDVAAPYDIDTPSDLARLR